MDQQTMQLGRIKQQAEQYYDKYKEHMSLLESKSILAQVKKNKGGVDYFDIWSLGKQLEQFEYYKAMCEEQGNVNLLGQIPNIALTLRAA